MSNLGHLTAAGGLARFLARCVCGHPHGNHVQNKYIPTGGCLADLNDGICNCERFEERMEVVER